MYLWQNLFVYSGHYLTWVEIHDSPADTQMGSRDTTVCSKGWTDSICFSPGANTGLCKSFPHSTKASFLLYDWYKTGDSSYLTNSSPYIDSPIWTKDFKLQFVSPKDLFHCSVNQSLCAMTQGSLLTLFYFFSSDLPNRPVSQCLLYIMDIGIVFHVIISVVQSVFGHAS